MNTKSAALLIAASLMLNGCAVPVKNGSGGTAGDEGASQVCNPTMVGLTAALVCGALASGNNRVRAGAACAAAAVTACYVANSYKAEQTRTAKQVEDEYLQRNRQLPDKATVTTYRSEVNPRGAVSRGQQVTLQSTIVAVPGRGDRGVIVEEELGIFDSQGEVWGKPVRKTANTTKEAGEFHTAFSFPVGDGFSQGVYTLRRTLYVNGVVAKRDDSSSHFQVAQGSTPRTIDIVATAN